MMSKDVIFTEVEAVNEAKEVTTKANKFIKMRY